MPQGSDEPFSTKVEESLTRILGDSGAKALLFYLGEIDPETFESKLHSVLGQGAELVIQDLKSHGGELGGHAHHHRFGFRAFGGAALAWVAWSFLTSLPVLARLGPSR